MNAALVTLVCLLSLLAGYRFYAKLLSSKVFKTDVDTSPTPATVINDGVDYVPTKKYVLFGHHFSSIAGAAPILGPAIAIIWGWLPALLWVVLGSILMGAVHDYGALVLSAKHKGKSMGAIAESVIGKRSKVLFLTIIFLLVFIVIAVFAYIIATLFVRYPGTVIPINFQIIIALFIGWWAYKKKKSLLWPSIIALILLYIMIFIGFNYPIRLPESLWLGSEVMTWILFLMLYGFIAAILPVWALLQPRDYINSHQLIVGLGCIYLSIFVAQPVMDAPALALTTGSIPWFPFLFVFIACGAISGFHSLVSSGTSSKQLANMKDSKFIGYGGMMGEACLAIAATIAVAAGFGSSDAWHSHYGSFEMAKGLGPKLSAFVDGTAGFLGEIGIDQTLTDPSGQTSQLAAVFIGVMVISFAATSLDTAIRIQRYIVGEIGETIHSSPLATNRYLQSAIAVVFSMLLVLSDRSGSGGLYLWPLFGSTNQLLGSLALLVISIWLYNNNRNYWFTLLPMLFITVITFIATYYNLATYWEDSAWLLFIIAIVIGICQLWIIFEGIRAFGTRQHRTA